MLGFLVVGVLWEPTVCESGLGLSRGTGSHGGSRQGMGGGQHGVVGRKEQYLPSRRIGGL